MIVRAIVGSVVVAASQLVRSAPTIAAIARDAKRVGHVGPGTGAESRFQHSRSL